MQNSERDTTFSDNKDSYYIEGNKFNKHIIKPHFTVEKMVEGDIFESISFKKQREMMDKEKKREKEEKGFFGRSMKKIKTEKKNKFNFDSDGKVINLYLL